MAGQDLLALEFEAHRPYLRGVAYRILGSAADADDAVQERRNREVVTAFFAAAREARFAVLLELLDPDVVMRADAVAARMGADPAAAGADAVAKWIAGRARGAAPALVGYEPGAAWVVNGAVRVAFSFTVTDAGRITAIDLIGDPAVLAGL
ncbi:MAG TPA: sigma factor, partial [Trebonia sp.]